MVLKSMSCSGLSFLSVVLGSVVAGRWKLGIHSALHLVWSCESVCVGGACVGLIVRVIQERMHV